MIRCLLSTIRWKTNGYFTIYRVEVTDITNFSYPELTPTFMRIRHKIRCLLDTIRWQANGYLTNYRVAVTDIANCSYPELTPFFFESLAWDTMPVEHD